MSMVVNPFVLAPRGVIGNATTFSPLFKANEIALSGGNLTASHGATYNNRQLVGSLDAKASGKWYFEIYVDNVGTSATDFGVAVGNYRTYLDTNFPGSDTNSVQYN